MRDFREVSTIELFYDTTKKLEKSTKTYYEIKDRNVRKVSEELHKRISKEIEDDFRIPSREEMDEIIISDLRERRFKNHRILERGFWWFFYCA